jgi:hypothetical protein
VGQLLRAAEQGRPGDANQEGGSVATMITAKTVFILGAGASAPYGFPTGSGLKKELLDNLVAMPSFDTQPPMESGAFEHLVEMGHKADHIQKFRIALRDSGRSSVDAFLEHRPEYVDVGKAAMAAMLLPCESHKALFDPDTKDRERWYEYLFSKLSAGFDDLDRNNVSFLTFNYDRSLEYYLITAIRNSYDKTFSEAKAKVDKLRILHLHGDLGPMTDREALRWRAGRKVRSAEIAAAANGIEIMHSAIADRFAVGRHNIFKAEVVCFLGFGYHPTNVERLLDSISQPDTNAVGTGAGMGLAERYGAERLVRKWLPSFTIDQQNQGALSYLKNNYGWW